MFAPQRSVQRAVVVLLDLGEQRAVRGERVNERVEDGAVRLERQRAALVPVVGAVDPSLDTRELLAQTQLLGEQALQLDEQRGLATAAARVHLVVSVGMLAAAAAAAGGARRGRAAAAEGGGLRRGGGEGETPRAGAGASRPGLGLPGGANVPVGVVRHLGRGRGALQAHRRPIVPHHTSISRVGSPRFLPSSSPGGIRLYSATVRRSARVPRAGRLCRVDKSAPLLCASLSLERVRSIHN